MYKIVFVGDTAVGKTSLLARISNMLSKNNVPFKEQYIPTIGVDYGTIQYSPDKKIQVFDTSGQERFKTGFDLAYKDADAIFIVVDCTSQTSLDKLGKLKNEVDENCRKYSTNVDGYSKACEIFLVVNKIDISQRGVMSRDQILTLALQNKIAADHVCFVSSKTGENVQSLVDTTVQNIQAAQKPAETKIEAFFTSEFDSLSNYDSTQSSIYSSYSATIKSMSLRGIGSYKIVVQLMKDYCHPHILGIGNRTFKHEMQILIDLAGTGYFHGSTQKLIDAVKALANCAKYLEKKDEHMTDTAQLIAAIDQSTSPRGSLDATFVEPVLNVATSVVEQKGWMSMFRPLQTKLEEKYQKVIDDHQYGSRYDILCQLLKAYCRSSLTFHWRTHSHWVQKILDLAQYDPKQPQKSYFQHDPEKLLFAIEGLKYIEGCFTTNGDLAAMMDVIHKNQDTLSKERVYEFTFDESFGL